MDSLQAFFAPIPIPHVPAQAEVDALCKKERLAYNFDVSKGRSFYELLNEWFNRKLNRLFSTQTTWDLIEVLLWLLLLFAVITILVVVLRSEKAALFFGNLRRKSDEIKLEDLAISDDNWQQLVDEALQSEQYNLLIRLYFIRILRDMNEAGAIKFRPEKTNSMYKRELNGSAHYQNFKAATRLFDFHIYGGFRATRGEYEQIKTLYQSINPQKHEISKA